MSSWRGQSCRGWVVWETMEEEDGLKQSRQGLGWGCTLARELSRRWLLRRRETWADPAGKSMVNICSQLKEGIGFRKAARDKGSSLSKEQRNSQWARSAAQAIVHPQKKKI